MTPARSRAAAATPPPNRYNLLDRSGVEVLGDCEEHNIWFVPYFPPASGRLAQPSELVRPAQRLGATTSQIALAWLLRRSSAIVAIPGTTNVDHLRDNVAAADIADQLADAEVNALTGLVDESRASLDQPDQSSLDTLQADADSHPGGSAR